MKIFLTAAIEVILTDKQKQVIEMYYLDNKRIPEIAKILGVHKSTVQRRLIASINKIKKNKKIFEKVAL